MQLSEIDFSTLEIKEMGAWPLILRVGVIIGACCLTAIALYFLVISREFDALAKAKSDQELKRKDFKEKYNMAVNFDAYKKQMVEMQSTYQDFLKRLPLTSNIPQLISDISEIGEEDNLQFGEIKLGDPKDVAGFYKELLISLDITGTYQNFGKFTSDVSKLPRIITFGDFVIKPVGGDKKSNSDQPGGANANINADKTDDTNASPEDLNFQIDTKTYWISNEPTTTTPAPSSAAAAPTGPGAPGAMPPVPGAPVQPGAPAMPKPADSPTVPKGG